MNRRTGPVLLLPLIAIMAAFYPFAFSPHQAIPSAEEQSQILHQVQQVARQEGPESTLHPSKCTPPGTDPSRAPHDVKRILCEFFGDVLLEAPEDGDVRRDIMDRDRRYQYRLDFMIVTIPDPIDSRLPYLFDREISSIQRAAEQDHFVLDRFDLAWIDEIRKKSVAKKSETASAEMDAPHDFRTNPGYMLFRNPDFGQPKGKAQPVALVLFMIGETPTTGIHKEALLTALNEIDWLCHSNPVRVAAKQPDFFWFGPSPPDAPLPIQSACTTIKILGPSFSGSAQSLDFALHSWLESRSGQKPSQFRIRSGTATAINLVQDKRLGCSYFEFPGQVDPEAPPVFASATARDARALRELLRYFKSSRPWAEQWEELPHVALLTEGNTAYGSSLRQAIEPGKSQDQPTGKGQDNQPPGCQDQPTGKSQDLPTRHDKGPDHILSLPFPLHISRLRSESEKARRERQQSSQQEAPRPDTSRFLPLPTEDDSGEAMDSIPPVSELDISSSELMLSNLLATISREQFQYVGIAATDVRDVIFLAREIREHSPSTVIFVLNADLIYTHPQANPNTRGMIAITPYPLFTLNQLWTSQNPKEGAGTRIQFPDQGSEGIYNAMFDLLERDHPLLEYSSPFESSNSGSREGVPPLWVVTVGRDGLWPVAIEQVEPDGYTMKGPSIVPDPKNLTNRGIVPQLTHVVLVLWSMLCLLPALLFLARRKSPKDGQAQWRFAEGFLRWFRFESRVGNLITLVSPGANVIYLIGGTATLSMYSIAITAYSVSAITFPNWSRSAFLFVMLAIFSVGLVACYSLGSKILASAGKGDVETLRPRKRWLGRAFVVAVVVCWLLAILLDLRWIYLRLSDVGHGVVTGFRAVNLFNGVSPLTPLFFLSLAVVFWAFCSIRRLRMNEEIPAISPPVEEDTSKKRDQEPVQSLFFYANRHSFRGVRSLERRVYDHLTSPVLRFPRDSRMTVYICIALALTWGGYLFFYRLVYGFESKFFYVLLGVGFLLVYTAVLLNVFRLFFLWKAVRALLQRLGCLPMLDAFSRFNRKHRSMPRISLATAPSPLTVMGFSINEAREWLDSVQKFPAVPGQGIIGIVGASKKALEAAEGCYERALDADSAHFYEPSRVNQIEGMQRLNHFTRSVEDVLEHSWKPATADLDETEVDNRFPDVLWRWLVSERKEKTKGEAEAMRKALTSEAEEFLVSRTVHFLAHIFPQLTNLAMYSMVCLFLLVLAVSAYPLQPKNPFAYFVWFLILIFVVVAVRMAFQLNRDAVLSCLNGTRPGEIHWSAEFIGRIVVFIVIPILGLLGVQFPDSVGQLLRWVAPAGSGHQ